eukprot:364011-Chlamydomonas_euryale.AAC.9
MTWHMPAVRLHANLESFVACRHASSWRKASSQPRLLWAHPCGPSCVDATLEPRSHRCGAQPGLQDAQDKGGMNSSLSTGMGLSNIDATGYKQQQLTMDMHVYRTPPKSKDAEFGGWFSSRHFKGAEDVSLPRFMAFFAYRSGSALDGGRSRPLHGLAFRPPWRRQAKAKAQGYKRFSGSRPRVAAKAAAEAVSAEDASRSGSLGGGHSSASRRVQHPG